MLISVALPLPVFRTFTYSVPHGEQERVEAGARVLVPFGRKEKIGWIDRVVTESDVAKVRDIHGVLDRVPTAPESLLRLCRWIADYYVAPLGQVLRTALPAALSDSSTDYLLLRDAHAVARGALSPAELRVLEWLEGKEGPQPVARLRRECGDRVWWPAIRRLEADGAVEVFMEGPRLAPAVRTRRVVRLTSELPSLRERSLIFARAKRQRECWELVESMGGAAELAHLTGQLRFAHSVVQGLVEKGIAEVAEEEVARDPYAGVALPPAPAPPEDRHPPSRPSALGVAGRARRRGPRGRDP